MSHILVLLQIARRNLFASFLNIIVGMIILGGTFFFVMGSTLLSNVDEAMSRSIIGSVAGHAQVYSAQSKDELSLFGGWTVPDITPITDFSKVKKSLVAVDNIKTVVPMGTNSAMLAYGNSMDVALEKLRAAVNAHVDRAQMESLKGHVRQMIHVIQDGFKNLAVISDSNAVEGENVKELDRAASQEFWQSFDNDALNHLEFLENKIASLVPDADFVYLNYLGTDLDVFQKSFDRMEIVDGKPVPQGQRGMLLSKRTYEDQFKLKIARRLDRIHEALQDEGKKIKSDPDTKEWVTENRNQVQEIILQLDSQETQTLTGKLQTFLHSTEGAPGKLLAEFLTTDDTNFEQRYKFFYEQIAPLVQLYRLRPGDIMTVKSFTKNGFVQAVNIKVYGTYQFKGLEKSGLAGERSLMDLMSFRDLYGYLTPDKLAEMKDMQKAAGTQFIDRGRAEDELFGGSGSTVETVKPVTIKDQAELAGTKTLVKSGSLIDRVYTPAEIDQGMVLSAALILKDPSLLKATMAEVTDIAKRDGLDLRVITWQKAAGNLGQFVFVSKVVLYVAMFIIFIVALVVINNAVMMVTLQRIREIGTMRAIGAQRSFVLAMVLVETLVLGALFGAVGILLGSGLIGYLGVKGIPAMNDFLYFFFSGPRLYPALAAGSVAGATIIVLIVATISALYPAILATRVSPVQAMMSED